MNDFLFQYCQKIVVFRDTQVLLCKRQGEADYDGVFSFIGGKMERSDSTILAGLRREKNEEVGADFQIEVLPLFSINTSFTKKDGNAMILPHYYARYIRGDISLSNEYSDYRWVDLADLDGFHPVIENVPDMARNLYRLQVMVDSREFVLI